MQASSLYKFLSDARDLRLLARDLGRACIEAIDEISKLRSAPRLAEAEKNLEDAVLTVELAWWLDEQRRVSGFAGLLVISEIGEHARLLEGVPPLACLAILRAICRKPLTHFYATTWDRHELQPGDPLPLPCRPTHTALRARRTTRQALDAAARLRRGLRPARWRATPSFATQEAKHLLEGTNFRFYNGLPNLPVAVELDFADRDNLDAATWIGDHQRGRFPLVASIHPHATGADLVVEHVTDTTFFGVRPRVWDLAAIRSQLEDARQAGIALLPELSLPSPAALAQLLETSPQRFPALVVAGSAHAEAAAYDESSPTGQADPPADAQQGHRLRVNEAQAYLHGAPLLRHRKISPFKTTYLPGHPRRDRVEDLSNGRSSITIACGTHTRLAVVICADLNDREIRSLLEQVAVNLLLVPALTPLEGAFSNACGELAGSCQALAVIVNGAPPIDPEDPPPRKPFMVMAAVPDPSPLAQVKPYIRSRRGRKAVGILDTSTAPPTARWL